MLCYVSLMWHECDFTPCELTTSTLCLPGGWGMEYLMKPWVGKGYSVRRKKNAWDTFHMPTLALPRVLLPELGWLQRCRGTCEDKSGTRPKDNDQLTVTHAKDLLPSGHVTFKLGREKRELDSPVPRCRRRVIRAAATAAKSALWAASSPERVTSFIGLNVPVAMAALSNKIHTLVSIVESKIKKKCL